MPKSTVKSSLAARIGAKARQAHEAHKNDETTYGNMDLPSGIEGGVAQLVDCKFGLYEKGDNKGKDYFYAAGIVKAPADCGGIPIQGLRTSIMEPLCDTKKGDGTVVTYEEHYAKVLNYLRQLGVNTAEVDVDSIESVAEALKESQPHFRFRTWKGDKQTTGKYAGKEPRVNHQWNGACEYVEDGESSPSAVEDSSGPSADEPAADGENYAALGEAADGGDTDAAEKIQMAALEAGISQEDIDNADNWVALAERIASPAEAEEAAPDADWKPSKGEVYLFKGPGKKKGVEHEVMAVFEAKRLVNLKNLDDGRTVVKSVSWDKLESA
jgi:hypothetical protein